MYAEELLYTRLAANWSLAGTLTLSMYVKTTTEEYKKDIRSIIGAATILVKINEAYGDIRQRFYGSDLWRYIVPVICYTTTSAHQTAAIAEFKRICESLTDAEYIMDDPAVKGQKSEEMYFSEILFTINILRARS